MKAVCKRTMAVLALCCLTLPALAQSPSVNPAPAAGSLVPSLIRFSGAITDMQGKPLAGMAGVTFAIYQNQTGGAPLWLETQNVSLDANGRYTIFLGAGDAAGIPTELFVTGEARWLGVQPEGQPEQPRVLLVSVPYAMKAADADTLGGIPASSYVTAEQLQNQLPVAGRQSPAPASGNDSENGRTPDTAVTPACAAVTSDGAAAANYITLFTSPCNIEKSGLYQASDGFIGLGTVVPAAPLDLEPAAQTQTSGTVIGEKVTNTLSPTANSAADVYGIYSQANTGAGNTFNFTSTFSGMGLIANHYGTGTVANMDGGGFVVGNRSTGTITNAAAMYGVLANYSTGTITYGYGVQVATPVNLSSGAITNYYGVYIGSATQATNSWGLYSLTGKNYISGDLGIGTATPTVSLEVSGNVKLDGTGHGITYPDGSCRRPPPLWGAAQSTRLRRVPI
jgi:trimeric autotransporter adhesin